MQHSIYKKFYLKKPREKLIEQGSKSLTNDELLSIVLRSGTSKENVFELTKRLIQPYGNAAWTKVNSVEQIEQLWNVGRVHACQILALLELGRRLFHKKTKNPIFKDAKNVANYVSEMNKLQKEQCRVLYLTTQNELIADEVISIGCLDMNIVHPREVFKPALLYSAASLIMIHNHPSGDPTPSREDENLTNEFITLGNLLKIPVLDHIVIGNQSYYSFQETYFGKLKK